MIPTTEERFPFDEAIANCYSNRNYANSYLFYAHIIGQCNVVFDEKLPAPAGVSFQIDHYTLYINPFGIPATKENPNKVEGFNSFPLEQRLGILKHEMLHILSGHVTRREDRDPEAFNIATDCAINQLISKYHLPNWVIQPDNFPSGKVPKNLTAEQYYEYITKKEGKPEAGNNQGTGKSLDDHSKWEESQGDKELQDDVTKNMIDKAVSNTTKSRGNIPSDISQWLDLFTHKREVDWRKVLRNIVGNKKVGIRKTLLRQDRRQPNASWIKGRTKDRIFEAAIISDTSGSVSDEALLQLWGEVRYICDITKTPINLVQVDTEASKPELLTKQTKLLERKHCGGTYMTPGIEAFKKAKINYDVLIITTDGYLDTTDVLNFHKLRVPVLWLIEADGQILPEMNYHNCKAFQLKT